MNDFKLHRLVEITPIAELYLLNEIETIKRMERIANLIQQKDHSRHTIDVQFNPTDSSTKIQYRVRIDDKSKCITYQKQLEDYITENLPDEKFTDFSVKVFCDE